MADFLWLLIPLGLLTIETIAFTRRKYAIQSLQQAIDNIHYKTDIEKVIVADTVKPAIDILYLLISVFAVPILYIFLLVFKKNDKNIDNILNSQLDKYEQLVKQSIICAFHTSFILSTIIAMEFVVIMGLYIVLKKIYKQYQIYAIVDKDS